MEPKHLALQTLALQEQLEGAECSAMETKDFVQPLLFEGAEMKVGQA